MDTTLDISYTFTFTSGECKVFKTSLDRGNLSLIRSGCTPPPPWAELQNHQCNNCPLDATVRHCPIAVNLVEIVEAFQDRLSHEKVKVVVATAERTYAKATTLQEGLSSLKGIIMVTSGCPVMDRLKPMVRFHLPFATLEETSFRMISMYMIAQYYRRREGLEADSSLAGLEAIYTDVVEINRCFAQRLIDATKKDANVNALVTLDCFAEMIPVTAEEMLSDIESCFSAYLT
jgi:hypothetical protein